MNTLINRNPLLDDFFKDVAPGFFIKPLHGEPLPPPSQLRIDVKESGQDFTVHADLPGVPKEDIQVGVEGNVVTIRAEVKQQDSHREGDKVLRTERYQGEVARSFQLPAEIDESAAKARYENGVLVLTLPKKAVNVPQRIRVE
ncbi:Hsp20/alpha crystallin family protein [Brachymonas sp. M4Q-1]|uniref:Hsp20/alpha crystallin family protein n=1 Tax=Brachymonas sp. M4Q-1 TaxID=3416906 RepID=UPI003CFB1A2E